MSRRLAAFALLAAVPLTAQAAPDSLSARPLLPAASLFAVPRAAEPAHASGALALEAGGGRVVMLPGPAASVFAADPKVAEARPASPTSLFIFGVAPGRTTIAALDAAGAALAQYDVTVRPSAFGASEAHATLARLLPGSNLRVDTRPGGMTVSGDTATAAEAERAMSVVQGYAAPNQTVDNRITVLGAVQVNLRVRILEVSRTVTRQLGINWQKVGSLATNTTAADISTLSSTVSLGFGSLGLGAASLNAVIDALAQDQLVTVLAEPNLTAQSGETASFLAGGEYPIPVGQQNGQITIEFKQYGVALAFVPTVLSGGHISLRVRPEVSELSTQGAVQLTAGNSTLQIPALTVRRADTTVELGSGQSFAIGGLMQASRTQATGSIPGLGEIPVIGALLRSDSFKRNESELVIVVTPYIVRPASDPHALRGPEGATAAPAGDLQRILLFRQYAGAPSGGSAAAPPAIPGDVGFIIR